MFWFIVIIASSTAEGEKKTDNLYVENFDNSRREFIRIFLFSFSPHHIYLFSVIILKSSRLFAR